MVRDPARDAILLSVAWRMIAQEAPMAAAQFSPPTVESTASDFATFGPVHLDVTDGERALGFWRDLVGLDLLGRDGEVLRLGVGDRELVVLHPGASGPVVREASGLYHMSLHLPSL